MDGIYELANAIIMQACSDYRSAKRKITKRPWSLKSKWIMEEVEQFIRSDWFWMLTDVDADWLLAVLQTEDAK